MLLCCCVSCSKSASGPNHVQSWTCIPKLAGSYLIVCCWLHAMLRHVQCMLSLMWTAEQIVRCVLSVFVYPGTENCEQIPSVGSLSLSILTAIFQVNLGYPVFIEAKDDEGDMTTGAISHAKLQSNHHHQQTNIQFFYRPDALPVAQPTVSKH